MKRLCMLLLILITLGTGEMMNAQTKYCRYEYNNSVNYGIVKYKTIYSLNKAPWIGGVQTGEKVEIGKVKLLCPSEPPVILGLGKSYKQSWEGKIPPKTVRWFIKPTSSAGNPNENIVLPQSLNAVKVEVELIIVIGKKIKNATPEEAKNAIFGYSVGNDIVGDKYSYLKINGETPESAGGLLGSGLKIGDGFEPFGPFIVTNINWKNRTKKLTVFKTDGSVKTDYAENTSDLIYQPEKIVSDLSRVLTLQPGDIISSGTGKSFLCKAGESFALSIEGIGNFTGRIVKK